MPRYQWSALNAQQVGAYTEYFVKMELTMYGFAMACWRPTRSCAVKSFPPPQSVPPSPRPITPLPRETPRA